MSTSSTLRVSGSKNPWKIKKFHQSLNSATSQSPSNTSHATQDAEQWPGLDKKATDSIKASKAAMAANAAQTDQSLTNHINTASSSPDIKYKSNQNVNVGTESNGGQTLCDKTTTTNKVSTISSPASTESASKPSTSNESNDNVNNTPQKTQRKKRKRKKKTNPNPSQTANKSKANKASKSSSNTESTSSDPISSMNSTPIKSKPNGTVSSSVSTDPSPPNKPSNVVIQTTPPNLNHIQSQQHQQQQQEQQTQSEAQTQVQAQPPSQSQTSHQLPFQSQSQAIGPNQGQSESPRYSQNGYNNNRNSAYYNDEMGPRSHNNYNHGRRRNMRGSRRGGRGRGGYRNSRYDDDGMQSNGVHGNGYQRNSYRERNGYRNSRRGSYRGNQQGAPPRHSRDRYRNNNDSNYYHNNSNQGHHNNHSHPQPNPTNNVAPPTPTPTPTFWNQPSLNGMYMNMPIPLIPYQVATVQPIPTSTLKVPSPRSQNADIKDSANEGEERKSDTTATTSSGSTVQNAAATNGSNTTPTPNGTNTSTATVNSALLTGANPLYFNPYLMPLNVMGITSNMNLNMNLAMNTFNVLEPPDQFHLTLNQMLSPPPYQDEPVIPIGPYYVLKVSCVATGRQAVDRSVGHIALIDWNLKSKANVFVKPEQDIVSFIEPLTSLTSDLLDKYGYPLEQAIDIIKSELPNNAVVIGQNITMDLQWLGLEKGTDYREFIDLRDLWRSWSAWYKAWTHYSLSHLSKCILNVGIAQHSAAHDAITTMKLFQYYLWCRQSNMNLFNYKVSVLQQIPIEPSFAKKNPIYEGVHMRPKHMKRLGGVPYITATPKGAINKNETNKKAEEGESKNDDLEQQKKTEQALIALNIGVTQK